MSRAALLFVTCAVLTPHAVAAQTGDGRGDVAHTTNPASVTVWAKPDHFWFRRDVPGGSLWLTVDAQHGVKEPLFDHQRLAIELNLRTGLDYTPLTLPFADPAARFVVKYDGSNAYVQEGALAIEFVHGDQQWRCELQIKWDWNKVPPTDYECLPRRPAVRAPAAAADSTRLSPDGRWEAFVHDHNVAVRLVGGGTMILLSSDGTANRAYQPGSIRWAPDAQSLSAYRVDERVWLAESTNANVRALVTRAEFTLRR